MNDNDPGFPSSDGPNFVYSTHRRRSKIDKYWTEILGAPVPKFMEQFPKRLNRLLHIAEAFKKIKLNDRDLPF